MFAKSLKRPVDHDIVEIKNWFTEKEKNRNTFFMKKEYTEI